jgi:hypothetical protein
LYETLRFIQVTIGKFVDLAHSSGWIVPGGQPGMT